MSAERNYKLVETATVIVIPKYTPRGTRNAVGGTSNKYVIYKKTFKNIYTVGQKVFSQPPIVQVLPLKNMREACNFHHR
jgi:hypothetical protein